jgi:flagellar basal-body rod protein FlgF
MHDFWLATCYSLCESMDQISVIAASGLSARMQSLELLANNMANASTNGFKGDGEFYTTYTSEAADLDATDVPTKLPMIQRQWTDFAQGLLEPTNNPLDFGLQGKGLFTVQGTDGPLYTRNGNFHVLADGSLTATDGLPVLMQDDQPVKLDPTLPLEVSPDGEIKQQGQTLGQLKIVQFKDTSALLKQGSNYYRNTGDQPPADAVNTTVHQGKIEGSNVSAAHGAVRLVGVMRQFEMMQKAISISNDMGRKAIEEVAKV